MRACLLALAIPAFLGAQTIDRPVRAVTDPGVVTTRQSITPAGVPTVFEGRVYSVAFGAEANELWVLQAQNLYRLDWRSNKVLARMPTGGSAGPQSMVMAGGEPLAGVTTRRKVQLVRARGGAVRPLIADLGTDISGSPATNGSVLAIPLTANNELAVIDLNSGALKGRVKTAVAPFGAAVSRDGKTAYVSNWGGRLPRDGDVTATSGKDQVVVDSRGATATGTVTRIDLEKMEASGQIAVELHPTALVWDEPRARLYVANSNRDSVSVIDTQTQKLLRTIPIQPFSQAVRGIAPTALAVSGDGKKLFVACGGINAVAIVDTAGARVEGLIPTAWYPNTLALSPDGKRLAIGALLGAGSGWQKEPRRRFVHSYRGSVAVVDLPDAAQLAAYTTAVIENNRMPATTAQRAPNPAAKPQPVPERSGEPSTIEHVVYIVKENRTYDQVFGDLPEGNGDPDLVMFGEDVTPNHRRLARQFVLLDNFYATGGNSADGHQWLTQANETAYCLWPGYLGRSYPFDGSDPIALSSGGALWDLALQRKKTVRIFGEYAGRMSEPSGQRAGLLERWRNGEDFSKTWNVVPPIASMKPIVAANYPTYTNAIPDVVRARIFLNELNGWEQSGKMPALTILQLPCDHTFGASPGASTPKAMVADNDLALGQIVEGLTKSKFWGKMAIFVVEDDAQNGVDHVDGHRTVALAISPWTKRGSVDSTFYSHQSMLKTIELILGLPTMSLFDLIATDMRASFQNKSDPTPYTAVTPTQSLDERNPPASALRGEARRAALDSQRMKWDTPDAAPSDRLNRILWGLTRGWNTPYPGVRQAVFAPLSVDLDDDDRD